MKKALVIIDIQNDYFDTGRYPLQGSEKASVNAAVIIKKFREQHLPVIYFQHISKREKPNLFEKGTPGVEIHKNVKPLESEKVFTKHYPNAFRETELHSYLQSLEIDHLVVCGMMTHLCIDASVRAAKDLGYKISLVADACATRDLEVYDSIIDGAYIQLSFLAALGSYYAKILTTEDFLNS